MIDKNPLHGLGTSDAGDFAGQLYGDGQGFARRHDPVEQAMRDHLV